MFLPRAILLLLVVGYSRQANDFDRVHGCRQFNSYSGYYTIHPYFDTSTFNNIKTDEDGVTRMRIGVLGEKHAAIRFTSVSTDSETSMTEIALAHYGNTRTDIRKFSRTIPKSMNPVNLGEFHIRDVMTNFKPVMLTIAFHRGGLVTVTREGESTPFLQFNDPTISHKYVGFCKWDVPVVFFYDCPLLESESVSNKVGSAKTGCSRRNSLSMNSCLKIVECSKCSTQDNCFSRMTRSGETQSESVSEEIQCF